MDAKVRVIMECRYDILDLTSELEIEIEDAVKLYTLFFSEMKTEIEELKSSFSKSNLKMMQNITHNIKGVSANLRIDDVSYEAKKICDMLKENRFDGSYKHIELLENIIDQAYYDIREFFICNGFEIER